MTLTTYKLSPYDLVHLWQQIHLPVTLTIHKLSLSMTLTTHKYCLYDLGKGESKQQ